MIPEPAEVETTEEQQAIAEGREIIERHGRDNWRLGELASQLHAAGQTDQKIAELWKCSQGWVNQCRRIHERFGLIPVVLKSRFAWVNWREMVGWSDADDLIEWAEEMPDAMFRDVVAFRNMRCHPESPGEQTEPSTETPPVITTVAAEPDPPICTPVPFQPEMRDPPELRPKIIENVPAEPARAPESDPATDYPPEFCESVRQATADLRKLADGPLLETERCEAAAELHKLADEIYPPTANLPATNTVSDDITASIKAVTGVGHRWTIKRTRQLKARLADQWWRDNWQAALDRATECAFFRGENDRGWTLTLDFLLRPDSVTRIMEGEFDDRNGTRQPSRAQQREDSNAAAFEAVRRNLSGRLGANAPIVGALVQHEGSGSVHDASGSDVGDSSDAVPF